MAVPTVATHIVDSLAAAGVKRIYGVVGDSLNGLTEAVRKHKEMTWIPARSPCRVGGGERVALPSQSLNMATPLRRRPRRIIHVVGAATQQGSPILANLFYCWPSNVIPTVVDIVDGSILIQGKGIRYINFAMSRIRSIDHLQFVE